MVNVMIRSVVGADELEGVPREVVAAVIVDGLDAREAEKAGQGTGGGNRQTE